MRAKIHKYTDEQKAFVRENIKGTSYKKMHEMFNNKFNTNLKYSQFQGFLKREKLTNGLIGNFRKGHEPWNKGMKGLNLGSEAGWFKKGQTPINYRPVGSERIDKKDGYIMVKVSDEGRTQDRWKLKHRVIWEKENGPIPKNHTIIFKDRNIYNFDLDNLMLVTRGQLLKLNQGGYLTGDRELLNVGLKMIAINKKINDVEIKGNDPEGYKRALEKAKKNGISESTFTARLKRNWSLEDAVNQPLNTKLKSSR